MAQRARKGFNVGSDLIWKNKKMLLQVMFQFRSEGRVGINYKREKKILLSKRTAGSTGRVVGGKEGPRQVQGRNAVSSLLACILTATGGQ